MAESPLIHVENVSFQYPEAYGTPLQQMSLSVHRGDRVLVIGHNGSGKSTLLSLIAGKRKPQGGRVRVMDRDPFDDTKMAAHITVVGAPWPAEAVFAITVDRICSPAPVEARRAALAEALHLRLSRMVDKMSSGEKRRVQILHGLMNPSTIYLLDECSTDIDVAERQTVLELVRQETAAQGGCVLYATHILDRIQDWATHVLLVEGGRVVDYKAVSDINVPLEDYAYAFMKKEGAASAVGTTMASPTSRSFPKLTAEADLSLQARLREEAAIQCVDLSYKDVFSAMNFTIYRGERVLLVGCNGAGKSTLLNMLGGKQFFNNSKKALRVLDKVCYDDMTLNGRVAYGGDWWTTTPGGEVHVREMLTLDTPRACHLADLLAVDMDWDVRHISSGEQKRVQLLLHLAVDKPVILLDEATADLDVDQRHALLQFLFRESAERGVTVVYSTHIFGGLEGWANTAVLLDRTVRGVHEVYRVAEGASLSLDALAEEMILLKKREKF